jgi:RHS repeat-associated protein
VLSAVVACAIVATGLDIVATAAPAVAAPMAAAVPAAETYQRPDAYAASLAARLLHHAVEVVDERSENTTTWANEDGTFTSDVAAGPIRVRRASGWADLDLTLASASGRLRPVASPSDVSFALGGSTAAATVTSKGRSLTLGWPSALPSPTVNGGVATYPNVLPNADMQLATTSFGYAESVVLRSRPAAAPVLHFPLSLSGLAVSAGPGGELLVKDAASGALVAQAPAPRMWDSSVDARSGDAAKAATIPTQVVQTPAGPELVLSPSLSFLTDPAVTYPVTIDPSVNLANSQDTWVQNDFVSSQYTHPWLKVGTYDGGLHVARSMIQWSTSAISGKHVLSSTLSLYEHHSFSCTASTMNLGPLAGGFNSGTVWTNQPGTTGTYGSSLAFAKGYSSACPAGRQSISVLPMTGAWAAGTLSNYGMKLTAQSETDSNGWKKFCSGNVSSSGVDAPCTTSANVPTLSVTYNSYPGVPAGRSVKPCFAQCAEPMLVSSLTPALAGGSTDADAGALLRYQFQVWAGSSASPTTLVSDSGVLAATHASGVNVSWNVPTGKLTNGSTYEYRMRAYDGTDYGNWSDYVVFTPDVTAPNTATVSSLTYPESQWGGAAGTQGSFTFGANGSTDVAGYLWGLDQNPPATYTTSTSQNVTPSTDGPHHLYVQTKDKAGNVGPVRDYAFNVGAGAVTSPAEGDRTQKRLTLKAAGQSTFTSAKFQYRRADNDSWTDIPLASLTWAADGSPVTNANVPLSGGTTAPIVWDLTAVSALAQLDGPVQIQAVFAPSGTSKAVHVTLDQTAYGDYATDAAGPGRVNLVTGNFTLSSTDVTVPSYGSDLTIGRTYQSRDPQAGATGMFGPGWTATVEVGAAGSDYGALTVTGNLVTIATSDGDTIAFTKGTTGAFTPEVGLESLALTYASATDTYTLADLDANTTVFTPQPLTTTTAATVNSTSVPVADASKVTVGQHVDVKNITAPSTSIIATDRTITGISGSTVTFNGAAVTVPSGSALVAAFSYAPSKVSQAGSGNTTSYSYDVSGGVTRVARVLAPVPAGVSCPAYPATLVTGTAKGCRALELHYAATTTATGTNESSWGDFAGRLVSVGFVAWEQYPATGSPGMVETTVATYAYDSTGRLRAAWDPRVSPALKTVYDYDAAGHVTRLTPASQRGVSPAPVAPWDFTYQTISGDPNTGRLATVSRTSTSTGTATTTVVYRVPVSGTGAPFDVSAAQAARWAQSDLPTDATAVFSTTPACPTSVATTTPPGWNCATVHYTDVNGREVNTASPAGGGVETTEYDGFGNVVRSLTAENRQAALDSSTSSTVQAATARTLDSQSLYSSDGQRLLETFGPTHSVKLASDGRTVDARAHTVNTYDEGAPGTGGPFNLVTTAKTGAREAGTTTDVDVRTTKTTYDWTLRLPLAVTADAVTGGLNLTSRTGYDTATGLVTSITKPSGGTTTNTAATTLNVYYTTAARTDYPECGGHAEWANLLCQTRPGGQPTTTDMAALPVTTFTYTASHALHDKTETVGATTRTTTMTYDMGRPVKITMTGVGTNVPDTETTYSPTTGAATEVCQPSCASGNARITREYDDLGREVAYTDANGVRSTTTYDVASRVVTTNDGKGTQTRSYDGGSDRRGLVSQLVDSAAGTFSATYDLGGNPTETYPNGIVATTTYDETDSATAVSYDQPGCAATDCNWFTDTVTQSIHDQTLSHASGLSAQDYVYDGAGRLASTYDTVDGACTTRSYTLDANSNRTRVVEYPPTTAGACTTTTTPTVDTTSFVDAADRLYAVSPRTANNNNDYGYDTFGRITRVPAAHARLTSPTTATYYVDDLVRSVTSGTVTRTWSRDPAGRLSGWTDGDPAAGMTAVNHFDGDGDSPSWTSETADGTTWTRVINTIATGLAVQTVTPTSSAIGFNLLTLHGDVAVTASAAATAPATPLDSFDATEYGTPRNGAGTSPRYGWLGGKQRSADAPAGLVLMGVRLYLPTTGRFLQVDPVPGGSATSYDYAAQDPINKFDLDGRLFGIKCKPCGKAAKWVANKAINVAAKYVAAPLFATARASYTMVYRIPGWSSATMTMVPNVIRSAWRYGAAVAGLTQFGADMLFHRGMSWGRRIVRVAAAAAVAGVAIAGAGAFCGVTAFTGCAFVAAVAFNAAGRYGVGRVGRRWLGDDF